MSPQRIQRKRTKGWRMPKGAVYVGRPTRWGNPFRAGDMWLGRPMTAKEVVQRYLYELPDPDDGYEELHRKDLVCWCPLDQPCHADVLLELANR